MARALKHITITNHPELLQTVQELRSANQPVILRDGGEDVAIAPPAPSLAAPVPIGSERAAALSGVLMKVLRQHLSETRAQMWIAEQLGHVGAPDLAHLSEEQGRILLRHAQALATARA